MTVEQKESEIKKGYDLICDIVSYSKNKITYTHLLEELKPLVKEHAELRVLLERVTSSVKRK